MNHSLAKRLPFSILTLAGWVACHAIALAQPASTDLGPGPLPKKLIAAGWDSPSPEMLLTNLREMEKTPFSGVRIQIEPKEEDGVKANFRNLFNGAVWKKEWFQKEVQQLKKAKSDKLTDNFLSTGAGPALDWFDDAGWEQVLEHYRIAAWIAKEGGLKGLMFDPEIGGSQPAFSYLRQTGKEKYSFAQYSAKARERGRQVMEVLKQEYPEMTLFTLFLNSGTALGGLGADPREGLEARRNYSLLPAFVNGWLDVIPPSMTIVDGAEYAYPHSSELQYLKHVNAIRNTSLALIAPENHAKYRAQMQAGLALYMDAYARSPLSNTHSDVMTDPPLEGQPVDRLQEALIFAQEAADQYIWVWGEKYRWWPTHAKRVAPQSWDDILPGASQALRNGMNREIRALTRAEREFAITEKKVALRGTELRNLVANGSFALIGEGPKKGNQKNIESWTPDQATASEGTISLDPTFGYRKPGSAKIGGPAPAMLSQQMEVTPYTFYKIRLHVRQIGSGQPEVRLRWSTGDASNANQAETAATLTAAQSPLNGWQPITTMLRAPGQSTGLIIELATTGQQSADDTIWFDDVEVIPVAVN